jgi:AraC family transcriptional regulator
MSVALARERMPRRLEVPGFTITAGIHTPDEVLPLHQHEGPTICCVLHGRFTEYSRGHAADCSPGTVKLTPAGEPHWNRFAHCDTRGVMVEVDPRRFEGRPMVLAALDVRRHERYRGTPDFVRELVRELARPDEPALLAIEGLLLEFLARLAREGMGRRGDPPAWLRLAEEVVRTRYREPLSLARVADLAKVHAVTLARVWRREHGRSLGESLRRIRLESAAAELVATDDSIADVALRAGFYDQSHFTNTFRRYLRVTPREYRLARRGSSARPGPRLEPRW